MILGVVVVLRVVGLPRGSGVLRETPDKPRPPAVIASIISFLRGDSFILVTRLFLTEVPCSGLRGPRLLDLLLTIVLLPSALVRVGRSEGSESSLSVSESRVPKRRDTCTLSSLRVLIGERSPGPSLFESKIDELEGRVMVKLLISFAGSSSPL